MHIALNQANENSLWIRNDLYCGSYVDKAADISSCFKNTCILLDLEKQKVCLFGGTLFLHDTFQIWECFRTLH